MPDQRAAPQNAYDDVVGMLVDLIDAFPPGFTGSHLAMHYETRLPELVEHVSAERQKEWEGE